MSNQIANVLKIAIFNSELSVLALSKETGVSQPIISRFIRGANIRLDSAQKLADYFGIKAIRVSKSQHAKPGEVSRKAAVEK